jgi:outer membrane protein insertion porin family
MMASKLWHAFLYVFTLLLLLGLSTLGFAQPSVVSAIERLKSNAPRQAQVFSKDESFQSPAKAQSILLAQNSAAPPAAVPSDLIAEISVEGSQRVDPTTVISYMKLKVGDRYDREKLDESLKSLFSTGYFRDVKFRREGTILVVQVKENPVVNRVAFEGNKRIKDEALEVEVKLKPRLVYTPNKLQTDAERIIDVYRKSGRFAVKVEPKLIELDQNRVDIVFEIEEGDLTKVHRIAFIGNKRFSDGQLRSALSTKESRWYRFLTSDDIYDSDRVSYDQELLRQYYLRNGYVDFQVVSSVAELTPSRDGFIITFTLEEGDRYDVGTVSVNSNLPNVDGKLLEEKIELLPGGHYDNSLVDETVDLLTDWIGKSGVAFFEVTPKVNRRSAEKIVDIVFDIGEGERVYIGKINISGNLRTLDSVIRREMQLAEGDAFNRAKIRESERRIRRLGFFERVNIEKVPSPVPDRVTLSVQVVENSTGELSFGAGLSSDAGVLGNASIRERNLLGQGQDLLLNFAVSTKDTQLDLSFTEPYFLNRPLSAGFDIFASEQDHKSVSAYSERTAGFGVRVGYEPAPRWRQTWSYSLKDSDISASSGASRFVLAQEGLSTTSKISQKLTYDATDNFFNPSEGLRLSWNIGLAGLGGSVAYLNNEAKASQFFSLSSETVLQLSTRAGAIFGFDQDIKLNDRYFLGGTNFRGFAFSGVGARDSATSDALGGNYYYLGSFELTFPLGLSKESGIRGRAFVDAGSVFHTDDSGGGINDSANPRASVGVGLTWESALGPLRLDFGYAILKEDFDQEQVFSFTFGTRF